MSYFLAIGPTLGSALYFLLVGVVAGYPATAFLEVDVRSRLLIAPAAGLGIFGVLAALAFRIVPLTAFDIAAVVCLAAATSMILARGAPRSPLATGDRIQAPWLLAATALAFTAAYANAPHHAAGGIALGGTIFDHAKVAIVDEIAREGLPPRNPFYQQAGTANLLNYYYLWYLVAATAERVTGANGWEADVALTGVSALLSLCTLGWAAVAFARRAAAAWWVLAIACAGSLTPVVRFVLDDRLAEEHRFEGWIEQSAWVPQHLWAATLALLAILCLVNILKGATRALGASIFAGMLIAASYDSSIWIGGFGLALVLCVLSLFYICVGARPRRWATVTNLVSACASAAIFAAVFLYQNVSLIGHRKTLGLWSYPVLVGDNSIRASLANEIAYWLVMLVADFGFAYLLAVAWCFGLRRRWSATGDALEPALALSIVLPLLAAQHLRSVIANNDLAWRIVLLPGFAMTIVAAATASRHPLSFRRPWLLSAIVLVLVPSMIAGLAVASRQVGVAASDGSPQADRGRLRDASDLWRAVRAVTPKEEAVLNNPDALGDMTLWPANIGWALLADRKSCAAGDRWIRSLAPQVLPDDRHRLVSLIARVFDGGGSNEDLLALKRDHLCATLVVVPGDGLWASPLLTDNPVYKLVESREGRWRLYR